jgi:hypothetical protein
MCEKPCSTTRWSTDARSTAACGAAFRDAPDVHRRIRELIVAESRCGELLSFWVGRDGDTVWLDITGAPEARPVIEELFARVWLVRPRRVVRTALVRKGVRGGG